MITSLVILVAVLSFGAGASFVIAGQRIRIARARRHGIAEGKLLDLRAMYARQRADLRRSLGR